MSARRITVRVDVQGIADVRRALEDAADAIAAADYLLGRMLGENDDAEPVDYGLNGQPEHSADTR
jgi:hypothetical protein